MTTATTTTRGLVPGRLSPSALEAYETCPRQFAYRYLDKAEGRDRPGPALVVGSAIHEALQLFFGLPRSDRQPQNLERALRHAWPHHQRDGAFATEAEEAAAGREALAILHQWAATADLQAEPLAREEWVRFALGEMTLFGKVDRIDPHPDGGLVVIDYKTGRRPITPNQLPTRAAQLYALATEARYEQPVVEVRFDYLALTKTITWSVDAAARAHARDDLRALAGEIRDSDQFTARPGRACDWCAYADICPDRGHTTLHQLDVPRELPF